MRIPMNKLPFEQIDDNHQRLKVPGGWIVKAFEHVTHYTQPHGVIKGWDWRVAMCFVPDPNHEWEIDREELDEDQY